MRFTTMLTLAALQAAGVLAAPVTSQPQDLAKDSIYIKSVNTYKRDEPASQLQKDDIII